MTGAIPSREDDEAARRQIGKRLREARRYLGLKQEEVSASLPVDVAHLARRVADLSADDREELARFADYLRSRAGGI